MLKKILSILMLTMIATTTIVRAELWLPDSDDSDEELLINDPVTDTQVTESPMKTVASKAYVDTKIETKQLKIPAAGQPNVGAGETVMTYTSTGNGQIGERGLYSDISSYDATTDGDKLITASALNATFTNLPTTPTTKLECANQADGCTLWTIVDQTAYGDMLPSGYTRLEYIEFTGNQWINTGVLPSSNTELQMEMLAKASNKMAYSTSGSASSVNGAYYNINGSSGGTANMNGRTTFFTTSLNTKHKIIQNRNGVTFDSTRYSYNDGVPDFSGTNPLWIGGGASFRFEGYVYSWRINENGNLVQNLVPARRNNDNVLGMYDTVSGTFKENAGTGTFTAGPDM